VSISAASSSSHRVLKGYFDKQKQGNLSSNANSEQSELASVFAKIALGRRNTVTGSAAAFLNPGKLLAKTDNESQVVPTTSAKSLVKEDKDKAQSTTSLCDTDNDSVFIRSDSLSSFASTQNLSSQSTVMPASTYLDGSHESHSIRSTDTLKSSLDSLNQTGNEDSNIIVNKVNKLEADEVLNKIDKVIKELDKDVDRTLTEISVLDTFDFTNTKETNECDDRSQDESDCCDG
jgi:hypothetical protein